MGDRWFEEDELREMSRPTMERIVEAIDAGDLEGAKRLAREGQGEWLMLHDLMAESILSLASFVQEKLGDEGVKEAWEDSMERGWKHHHAAIESLDRKAVVGLLAATWRAHSAGGVGEHPGRFTITEDDEKVTFTMNPCGSGQRLVRMGRYDGDDALGTTNGAHEWSYGREGFPLYCTHCSFMNELQPIRWIGFPLYPSHPPADFHSDPCVWHWYKDPADIPAEHWERYGLTRDGAA
jgi:hypothetical protein